MRNPAVLSAALVVSALSALAGPEDPQDGGKWAPPVNWSFVPVSAATLPDGRILGWASNERLTFPAGPERTYTSVWDPQTGQFQEILHPTHDMFCGNQVMLEDGTVYVTGGRNQGNSPWTSMFDYRTNQWIQRENMNRGRWYPTSVALPNGKVFIAIGEGGGNTAEIWNGGSQWTLLSGLNFDVPILNYTHGERNWTPLMQLAPDGRIFHLGPTPKMHMIDTTGVGSITQVGPQITAWYPKDSATVMYDEGKILTAGGWISGTNTASSARAMVIDINGASPQVTDIGNMAFARRFHNAVTLPNGEVALFGGNTSGEKFSDLGSVLAVEIFNPTTRTFRLAASMSVPRNYHSVALLMIDGRVWSGGGGLCGCAADHPDAQIWSPPYLFNADGTPATRPQLHSAPGKVVAGSNITVRGTPGLTRFSLVKMSTETHSNNSDMRYLTAPSQETIAGEYTVTLHANSNVLTPGYWMLFGSNAQGTPSVAKVIQVSTQGTASGPPVLRDITGLTHARNSVIDMTLSVIEPDGNPLTFSATGLPPGITLNALSGRLSGTVTTSGTYAVTITVNDGVHGADSTSFTWRVLENLGLNYEYYQGSFDVLPNFDALTPLKSGTVANFTLAPRLQEDFFAFRFRGRIDITTAGSYRFFTASDDGSRLFIDGALVVNNDGLHGTVEQFGDRTLTVGTHTIEVTFFEKTGGANLTVSYQGPGIAKQLIPDTVLLGVAPQNQPPNVTNPGDRSTLIGSAVTLPIVASDPNPGDVLTYSATGLPPGLAIDPATGTISGTVTTAGLYGVQITVSDGTAGSVVSFTWTVRLPNAAPTINAIADQASTTGATVSLQVSASDPNGDALTYSATGLPAGLSIGPTTGLIGGVIGSAGSYTPTVTVTDGALQATRSFNWTVTNPIVPITIQPIASPPREAGTAIAFTVNATGNGALSYRWSWGDGSPTEGFSASPSRTYSYAEPGRYVVTVTVRDALGEASYTFTQAIHGTPTATAGRQDSTIVIESVTGTPRVWTVNPDANTVTIINANTYAKVAEIGVGTKPSSLALGGDGRMWVANKRSSTITRIDPVTRAVFGQVTLPRGSAPHGLVASPASGDVYVVLEALGQLARLNGTTGAITGQLAIGANARHLSISGDGTRIYVSRFVTPPLPGESTATPAISAATGGEVLIVDATNLTIAATIVLPHSNATISEHSAPGLPNYLRAPALSPDGLSAWVPSKQDNILRGTLRNGAPLDRDHTVRAISSRIDLATRGADLAHRVDHDNASIASAAAFDRTGSYLFVALEGNRMVAAVDAYRGEELFRFASGRAPEGLVMHPDGKRLFVQNFMDRTVSVHDLSVLIDTGANGESRLATVTTVATETLTAQVLLGKQHFYDALDPRLAMESYMACAACHNDGGQDGRTWDFTGFNEGVRNTTSLEGQGGTANGPVHWTGNFDEIQDFEGQIRSFVQGLGLMSDASFHTGTRSLPLGDPKAGLSPDLDALAAYLASLATVPTSPYRATNGALTTTGEAGKNVFIAKDCGSCHAGTRFTDSALGVRHDVGTIKAASGARMGGVLDGFDTPTLRGLWATAPYLHDGSAATLGAAVDAHTGVSLTATERSNLVDYLLQIDASEPTALRSIPRLEALTVTGVSSAGWTPVTLASRYTSLVAVCTIHQAVNTTPQVVRMRQVAADRIELALQSPENRTLAGEKLYCLAAEEGKWLLPNGRKFEARRYQSTRVDRAGSWIGEQRTYLQSFTSPVVLGQVMSYNDARWSTFWARGASKSSVPSGTALYTGYTVGEDTVTTRASEAIGYLVFEAGSGTLGTVPYEAKVGADTVRGWDNSSTGYAYTFGRSFTGPRVLVATQAAMDGTDGSFAIIRGSSGLSATTVRLIADEDNVRDTERSHPAEQVSYFVIDQPTIVTLTPAP